MAGPLPVDSMSGRRVLVVEDDYFIANEIQAWLTDIGCEVFGPFCDLREPVDMAHMQPLDAAVLDVNLSGQTVYPLASKLLYRHVPVLFVTGYGTESISPQFRAIPRLTKPIFARQLQQAVFDLVCQNASESQDRGVGG